jgi:hypothetical protein
VPSANGCKLEVNGHTLVAYCPAPFFVLEIEPEDRDEDPLLIHCEDIDDARSIYRCCSGETYMLDANFERINAPYRGVCQGCSWAGRARRRGRRWLPSASMRGPVRRSTPGGAAPSLRFG